MIQKYQSFFHITAMPFEIIDFKDSNIQIVIASSFVGNEKIVEGEPYIFKNYIIPEITPYLLTYHRPKLVKLNKKNVYDLLAIKNDISQLWFMGDTKYMLAYQYVEKYVSCYVLMDHHIVVGTISLYIDQKGGVYWISNVLIDKRYQKRGYGKALINESLKVLKKKGCTNISLWVERANVNAFHTYQSCGFEVRASYPMSFELYKKL